MKKNSVPREWLRPDREFSKLPDPADRKHEHEAWWPTPHAFDDDALAESRSVTLRQRAFDLGMMYFLLELIGAGRIERPSDKDVAELIDATSYFGFNALLGLSRRKLRDPDGYATLVRKHKVSSASIAELFGIASGHRATLFRKKLVRLGSVGMVLAKPGRGDGFEVELGPAGIAFFMSVYLPIIKHMPLQQK